MSKELWEKFDRYVTDLLVPTDPAFDAALAAAAAAGEAAGLPAQQVSPPQGKLLMLLAMVRGARSILEVGTLGGYSTMWLARGLPAQGGRLITLELNPTHAEVARANLRRAGFDRVVEVRVGPAVESLARLEAEGAGPFDLVFIDADKAATADYFASSLRMCRRGSVIVVDNVVRDGAVADAGSTDPSVRGIRRFMDLLAREPRVTATAIQTVGSKGYDGFAVALVG